MRRCLQVAGLLACSLFVSSARADAQPDPLRLVPDVADVFVKIEHPRRLLEASIQNDLLKQLQTLDAVRELYESTNYRRFQQLIAYFEKQLGANRYELLDRLAGNGIVIATKLGPQPPPSLLVIQGKDEELTRRFAKTALAILEQELARQESKDRPEKSMYRDVETVRIGKERFYFAAAGSALLVSNAEIGLKRAIDLYREGGKNCLGQTARVAQARKLLDPDPLAWMCLNMETVRKAPQAKEVFTLPRNDVNLTVLFGGLLDVGGRSSILCGGLYPEEHGFVVSLRMPAGREGMNKAITVHVPPAGQAGSRPLLEPRGVLYSSSYYFDLSKFWEYRTQLFNEKQVKSFESFDKTSKVFLAGSEFSKLVSQAGAYQRFVAVPQHTSAYAIAPQQRIPAFALVVEMREPDAFSKKMDAILRSVALFAGIQSKLKVKPAEESYHGRKIVGYRFPVDVKVESDAGNYRYNFSPSFTTAGNQFVASSTIELCRELVDLLEKEAKEGAGLSAAASVRTQVYAAGGAELLESFKDRLFAQTMLDQALSPAQATEQVQAFVDWVRRLGVLQIEATYGAKDFRYDIRLRTASSKPKQLSQK
jgi:hypothetical protein